MKNEKITIPDKIKVWCTDRDQELEVLFISQQGNAIRTSLEGIPLMFNRIKPGLYVANFSGMEFVMKL
jgi:hypothetical protein